MSYKDFPQNKLSWTNNADRPSGSSLKSSRPCLIEQFEVNGKFSFTDSDVRDCAGPFTPFICGRISSAARAVSWRSTTNRVPGKPSTPLSYSLVRCFVSLSPSYCVLQEILSPVPNGGPLLSRWLVNVMSTPLL
jgi:hypothetical protein